MKLLATMQAENGGSYIMDKDTLINNLLANYGKYGVTRAELEPIIDDGIRTMICH